MAQWKEIKSWKSTGRRIIELLFKGEHIAELQAKVNKLEFHWKIEKIMIKRVEAEMCIEREIFN